MNRGFHLFIALCVLPILPVSAAEATYQCGSGVSIDANFNNSPEAPSVALSFLASGRRVVLPQALSADGGRYVGSDIVFWIKGRSATLTEKGQQTLCQAQ